MANLTDSTTLSQKSIVSKEFKESSSFNLYLKQLEALIWKSAITRRVHYVSTFFELIGPLLLPLFAALLFSRVSNFTSNSDNAPTPQAPEPEFKGPEIYEKPVFQVTFGPSDFKQKDARSFYVYYAPKNGITDKLVSSLSHNKNVKLIGFTSEELLKQFLLKEIANQTEAELTILPMIGVSFGNVSFQDGQISYHVLQPSTKEFNAITGLKYPMKFNQEPSPLHFYSYFHIAQLLSYINRDYIFESCNLYNNLNVDCNRAMKNVDVRRMPYPRYRNPESESKKFSIYDWIGFITVLSYVLVCPLIVKRITDEKDTKVKEMLRMIGMSDLVFWSSHFFSYFIIIIIQAMAFVYIFFMMENPILKHSSVSLFFTFFIMYGIQLIIFSMLITTIFNRPVLAVVVTTIIWILSSTLIFRLLTPSLSESNIEKNNPLRLMSSLIPTGSLIWFCSIMGDLENKETGLHWSNINSHQSIYNDFNVLSVLLTIVMSCILNAFLIFYLDNVWPFQHGIPKSPFFIFKSSYWFPATSTISNEMPEVDRKIFEAEPESLNAKIQIQNVCKSFRAKATKKLAVDHLWLNIYENQLTVLLGHNGAGKTTTMNMITGMFPSSSGSIYVNRYNVFTQTNQARRSIGLCPQENIYFNELTVGQHLKLFALLKDFPSPRIDQEINSVLELLALKDKKNVLASKLSGGMKRKLALGIALIGDTETLILDEPTSGMDPEARRVIWDLLISLRRKRTILLTTHYMEEADVLADRIAIMNEGKLCCSGSPLFLKTTFGTGYRLRVAKSLQFDSSQFVTILQQYIPSAKLISEVETEVVYGLDAPKTQLLSEFPMLFADIERNKQKYHVESCGLSYTTLEDVFLTVGAEVSLTSRNKISYDSTNGDSHKSLLLSKQSDLITGPALLLSQFTGLFLKRLHFARRYWPMVILQLIIPAAIIALAMYVDKQIRSAGKANILELNVQGIYGKNTEAYFHGDPQYFHDYSAVNSKYHAKTYMIEPSSGRSPVDMWNLQQANSSYINYIHSHLYGLEVTDGNKFNAWFNNEQYHSLPLSIITLYESLLRSVLPEDLKNQAKIGITSIPLISQDNPHDTDLALIIISWIITCLIFLPVAFPFLAASYILYPIKEQASKSKLIQLMTGLSPTIFWISNFFFDILNHLIATAVIYLVIYMFDSGDGMFGQDDQNTSSALFLLILSFGVSTIPLVYALSYFFSSSPGGFIFVTILYLIFGLMSNIIFSTFHIMNNYAGFDLIPHWINPILLVVRILPIFSLLFGYQKVYLLSVMNGLCHTIPNIDVMCQADIKTMSPMLEGCCLDNCGDKCYSQANAFSLNTIGAGIELLYLILTGLFFFVLIVLFESRKLQIMRFFSMLSLERFRKRTIINENSSQQVTLLSSDSDVERERTRIEEEIVRSNITDLLTVYRLRKTFGNLTAVDDVSFGVRHDECFGFLGVNGAGKTTTFSMLTGDIIPSSGNAYIKNGEYSLLENMQQFQRNIGYCPQFDALLGKLTGEETLYLFARLRGVSKAYMKRDIDNLIRMVGLEQHSTRLTETYSGGNRRKLSIAIALIGSPCLIFLDEPSAGVDPAARRKIWQTLGYIKRNLNSSIVLTSHSMEECEALCSRIVIMVAGKFRCLGSTQHLRNKYGQGYSVAICLNREHETDHTYFERIQQEISKCIPSAILKDYHQCLMHYHITDPNESWANIFTQMNTLNEMFQFEDYFVSDTTLEQIFIMFARHQQNQNTSV